MNDKEVERLKKLLMIIVKILKIDLTLKSVKYKRKTQRNNLCVF